ncbi:TonB-dependent siderophore receptor [Eleftheria terrae]|uniref:TonB-dependent siderophore receptor n=1 Tax=Eleftheria terrae TaxID=1597781 RepID=UPI00263ABA59|nr:TonB-dependent siderophore receptor [Eleftheria terrae]WKB55452.1 TonB-dependent siderophore receptor [Eleftheria terrae]
MQASQAAFPFPRTRLARSLHLALLGLSLVGAARAQQAPQATDTAKEASLPAVRVTARREAETATGPVRGYVARRSATATKTDTPIAETPQSISVVTRDQMDAQNVQSVGDALRYTAGVMAEANGPDPRADVATIRGFGGGRSAFRDGLRDHAFGGQGGIVIEPWGLERIEVLRGPASVLYGQGDAGGMLNLVSKRPQPVAHHEVQLQLGNHGRKQAAVDVGGPLAAAPEWSYRLNALVRDADTEVDHVKDDRLYIAPALTWRPSAATSLTLLASYQKNERGQGYQSLPRVGTLVPGVEGKVPTERFVGEPGFERFDQEQTSIGYQFEHRLGEDWTLRQNLRVMNQDTLFNSTYHAGLHDDGVTIDRLAGQGRERVRNVVLDNQAQWTLRGDGLQQTLLFGLDHQRLRATQGTLYTPFPTLNVYHPVYGQPLPVSRKAPPDDTRKTLTQTGVYVQDQLKFNDRIAWTVGGRYDTTRSNETDLASRQDDPQRDHAFTWRTGVVYLADGGWAPYAGYARSFSPQVGSDAAGRRFDPEKGEQFEVGVRYQPAEQDFSLLASVYDLRRQNVLVADPVNLGEQVQRGEVRSRGLELEAKATLMRSLDLVASYAYNDLEVTRSTGPERGHRPSASPKSMASVWASWRVADVPGLKLSGGVRHVGSSYGDEEETLRVPSHTLVDAAVEVNVARLLQTTGDWRLALNVSNLFDKTYVSTCGYFADGCKYGYGRRGTLTLSYRW